MISRSGLRIEGTHLRLPEDRPKTLQSLKSEQYVIDWDNDTEFGLFEAEAGYVLESGNSFYGRPGIGFGGDKSIGYNFEFGIKYIF